MSRKRTFQVTDSRGQVWPPGFRSQLCDPASPLCVMPTARQAAARVGVAEARARCSVSGEGWGRGTMHWLPAPKGKH